MGITTAGFCHTLHVHLYTSSHQKKMNETRYKNILSEKVSGI